MKKENLKKLPKKALRKADVIKSVCEGGHVWNTSLFKINNRTDYCVWCGRFKQTVL